MKIFISYATQDRKIAESLYGDIARPGVEVFQFGRTETIGTPSWTEVVDWINTSDSFIVLVSENACRSRPVREEIEQANYSYINRNKPGKLIPAIIEIGARPPLLVERFTSVDLVSYEVGVGRLLNQLGLERRTAPPPRARGVPSLPDLGRLLDEHKKAHPEPSEANLFSKKAEKLVAAYDEFKPPTITGKDRAKHIDSLLADLSGSAKSSKRPRLTDKYDDLYLGLHSPAEKATVGSQAPLWKRLLERDSGKRLMALEPPTLTNERMSYSVTWNPILGATAYALEGSAAESFASPQEIYRGRDTQYKAIGGPTQSMGLRYLRVKAIGSLAFDDSGWSNVVDLRTPSLLSSPDWAALGSLLGPRKEAVSSAAPPAPAPPAFAPAPESPGFIFKDRRISREEIKSLARSAGRGCTISCPLCKRQLKAPDLLRHCYQQHSESAS